MKLVVINNASLPFLTEIAFPPSGVSNLSRCIYQYPRPSLRKKSRKVVSDKARKDANYPRRKTSLSLNALFNTKLAIYLLASISFNHLSS